MDIRVGQGYDVHQLVEGYELRLGGVPIDYHRGLKGHSDADVLLHALCDAFLGALNKGDIGSNFPPSDSTYRGISSLILLEKVNDILLATGFNIANIDTTICLQEPKLNPYISQMKQAIAGTLGIAPDQVSIKATTTENLGPEGRGEGISASAIVLLKQ